MSNPKSSAAETATTLVVERATALGPQVLRGEAAGTGRPIVGLHGLTATRRNVFHGSRLLERAGARVVLYDARGHGASDPAPRRDAYSYDALVDDLEALLEQLADPTPPVLVGVSMGAATAAALALRGDSPLAALVLVTPPPLAAGATRVVDFDAVADALAAGELRLAAERALPQGLDPRWRQVALAAIWQRLSRHRHPHAVADALRVVPRSRPPFDEERLRRIELPVLVVGSRDEADPLHPLAEAERWASTIPGAQLLVEEPGRSPLAWQGAQLSRAICDFLRAQGLLPAS